MENLAKQFGGSPTRPAATIWGGDTKEETFRIVDQAGGVRAYYAEQHSKPALQNPQPA
jgi:hypothetical protein